MAPNVEIEYLLNQYKEAINTSDAKLAESLYTIDNKHYPVDVSSTITSESILEHYENLFAQNDMNIDLFIEEISLEDNMACVITTSIGMLHFFCDENKVPEKKRTIFLVKNTEKYGWKIIRHISDNDNIEKN